MTTSSELPLAPSPTSTQEAPAEGDPNANRPEEITDERIQKRLALGLSPQRPTARAAPVRPPDNSNQDRIKAWSLVGLVSAIAIATILLVVARIAGFPTDWSTAFSGILGQTPEAIVVGAASTSAAQSESGDGNMEVYDFSAAESSIPQSERVGAYAMAHIPSEGVYRIELEPQNVAWVVPGPSCESPYRLMANVIIDPAKPDSRAGLYGRIQESGDFYLFTVDGLSNFEILLLREGEWQAIQAGTHETIRPAGERNTLALGDDGTAMVFVVNGEPLYRDDAPLLPLGKAGFGGRAGASTAQIDFAGVEIMSACQSE